MRVLGTILIQCTYLPTNFRRVRLFCYAGPDANSVQLTVVRPLRQARLRGAGFGSLLERTATVGMLWSVSFLLARVSVANPPATAVMLTAVHMDGITLREA